MKESWRPVVGYEGLYEVSSMGRVRGLDRRIPHCEPRHDRKWTGRIIKPIVGSGGYACVTLYNRGRQTQLLVHRIVLEAFVGPAPARCQARHWPDRSRTNNRIDNLLWGSAADNAMDRDNHGTTPRGEMIGLSKLTSRDVIAIRNRYRKRTKGRTLTDLACMYGVSIGTIHKIIIRKTWAHVR